MFVTFVGSGKAQGLADMAVGAAVGAGTVGGVSVSPLVDASSIEANLKRQGYTNFTIPTPKPNSPYQFTATSPDGTPVTMSVDTLTGGILSVMPQ